MIIDFIKEVGMALVWLLLGYFIGESNARSDCPYLANYHKGSRIF